MNSIIPARMKFIFTCKADKEGVNFFTLRNASSNVASNFKVESFELTYLDGAKDNLLTSEVNLPDSLGSNEQHKFNMTHRLLKSRPGLAKQLELFFSVEDEYSNLYRCHARIDVQDPNKEYATGAWEVNVYPVGKKNGLHRIVKSSGVVYIALCDAESAIQEGRYDAAVDRVHTAFHGYLQTLLNSRGIQTNQDESLPSMYAKLHKSYNMTTEMGMRISGIVKSGSGMIQYINEIRNKNTPSHPNKELVQNDEAVLVIRLVDAIIEYISSVEEKI